MCFWITASPARNPLLRTSNPAYISHHREHTLIAIRRTLAERNASLVGFTFVESLARPKVSIAAFSEERATFYSWDSVSVVEEQGRALVAEK